MVLVCFFLLFAGLVFWGFKKISYDLGQSPQYLLDLVTTARLNYDRHQSQKTNFIVLGLDKRDDQLEKTQTTDRKRRVRNLRRGTLRSDDAYRHVR